MRRSSLRIVSAAAAIAVCVVIPGCSGSQQGQHTASPPPVNASPPSPPPAEAMEAEMALGLWKSTFGAVKVEKAGADQLAGIWLYSRDGREIIGYFEGTLNGNVLDLRWYDEGPDGPLLGAGFLAFDPGGRSFNGSWWTDARDRSGTWSGWREPDNESYDGAGDDSQGQWTDDRQTAPEPPPAPDFYPQ